MNVAFPGYGSHAAFWIIVGVMFAALVGMIGFFRYKRWI
jgi:Mg2+ and Co2+ transporter CorA